MSQAVTENDDNESEQAAGDEDDDKNVDEEEVSLLPACFNSRFIALILIG